MCCVIGSLARVIIRRKESTELKEVKEQYFPANIDLCIRDFNTEYSTVFKRVCCRKVRLIVWRD